MQTQGPVPQYPSSLHRLRRPHRCLRPSPRIPTWLHCHHPVRLARPPRNLQHHLDRRYRLHRHHSHHPHQENPQPTPHRTR